MRHDIDLIRAAMNIEKRLTPQDVHVDRPLTNISVAYMQSMDEFVADRIFPRVPVQKQSDQYYLYDRSYYNRSEMRQRPPSTETPGIGMKVSTDTYFCDVYGLHYDLDDRTVANADNPLAPRREGAELLTYQGALFREITWTSTYFTPGVWSAQEVGIASNPVLGTSFLHWSDAASDPIGDVKRWKREMRIRSGGFRPNVMVISEEVFDVLTEHPQIIDRVKYGQTAPGVADVSRATLATVFEMARIEVLTAVHNTAAEGAAEVNAYIAGKHVALYYTPPTPGLRTPTAGYTFVWSGYVGASEGQRITSFDLRNITSGRIEIESTFDHKLIGNELGFFGSGAVV